MVLKFPWIVFIKFLNCWISEMRAIQITIPEYNKEIQMEWKFPIRNSRKLTSRGCFLFKKFWKMLFHSPLEISWKSNQGRFPIDQWFRFAFLEIFSGEWNNSRFARYPVPQFLGLSYLLGSQVLGFQLLGSQFLSSWAPGSLGIRWRFPREPPSPLHLSFLSISRCLKNWGIFVRMEGVNCWFIMVGFALRSCSILWLTNTGWIMERIFWLKIIGLINELKRQTSRTESDLSPTSDGATGWSDAFKSGKGRIN